jgi:hypothetical protein
MNAEWKAADYRHIPAFRELRLFNATRSKAVASASYPDQRMEKSGAAPAVSPMPKTRLAILVKSVCQKPLPLFDPHVVAGVSDPGHSSRKPLLADALTFEFGPAAQDPPRLIVNMAIAAVSTMTQAVSSSMMSFTRVHRLTFSGSNAG